MPAGVQRVWVGHCWLERSRRAVSAPHKLLLRRSLRRHHRCRHLRPCGATKGIGRHVRHFAAFSVGQHGFPSGPAAVRSRDPVRPGPSHTPPWPKPRSIRPAPGRSVLQHQRCSGGTQSIFLLLRIQRLAAQVNRRLGGRHAGPVLRAPQTARCGLRCGPGSPAAATASATGDIPVPNGSGSPAPTRFRSGMVSCKPTPLSGAVELTNWLSALP